MLFTSYSFYFFLVPVLIGAWTMPWRARRWLLIGASYFFYSAAEPWYCLLLASSTALDYILAQRIERTPDRAQCRRFLWVSVTGNIGMLGVFKYADFSIDNLNILFQQAGLPAIEHLDLILPIGISFYTFQTLSYTIDVYRGKQQACRDLAAFALYVSFFPQLVAGPIERARRLLPQFQHANRVSIADIEAGVQRILWGLTKKLVFADRLALTVDPVFSNPSNYSSPELLLATFCFSFQLYLDFSAYVDIAIGLARLLGVRLSENFNYPFLARNPSDFWSRWHITLTSWFRDYLFRALGGVRRSSHLRTAVAILITMSVMGLWHGPAWHYVVFGLLSGLMVVVYTLYRLLGRRRRNPVPSALSTIISIMVMTAVINFIMIFFRAPELERALELLSGIVQWEWGWRDPFWIPLGILSIAWLLHILRGTWPQRFRDISMSPFLRALAWFGMVLLINYLTPETTEPFIYFQF